MTPVLVKDDITAQAYFDELAESYLEEDVSEINLHFDSQVDEFNRLMEYKEIKVEWFNDIEVNDYKNPTEEDEDY